MDLAVHNHSTKALFYLPSVILAYLLCKAANLPIVVCQNVLVFLGSKPPKFCVVQHNT